MTTYILNGFSFLMNQPDAGHIDYKFIDEDSAKDYCRGAKSMVGKKNLANVLSNQFGYPVEYNPGNIEIQDDDIFIVAYITGKQLPENATTLPRNVAISYVVARLEEVAV